MKEKKTVREQLAEALEEQGGIGKDGKWHAQGCHPTTRRPFCASWCKYASRALDRHRAEPEEVS